MNPSDYVGQKINRWHIDSIAYKKGYETYFNCTCDCGNTKIVNARNLISGKSKSCGCLVKETVHEKCFIDLEGQKFNKLTCIKWEHRKNGIYWLCKCDCGKETWVEASNLKGGLVKSCGCARDHLNRIHGMSHTRIHNIWSRMHYRCTDPNYDNYARYGGRGIKVCDEWQGTQGFINFMNWSLENGYTKKTTIDRIDNDGNYEPSNCRWTTQSQQMRNTSINAYYEYQGAKYTIIELSEKFGIPYKRLHNRLRHLHWDLEEAIEIKPHIRNSRKKGTVIEVIEDKKEEEKAFVLTSENYHSPEANLHYVDCSTYKNFVGTPGMKACECKALAIAKGEYERPLTDSLLVGSYVDAYFDNSLNAFKEDYPQIYTQKGELKSQFKQAEVMIARCEKDELFMKYMRGDTQQIFTSEINGVPVRIKIDSFDGNRITDLKTCQSISETYYAKDLGERLDFITYFGYVEQAYFYKKVMLNVTGKDYPFYIAAVSKDKEGNIPHPRIAVIQIPDRVIWDKGKEIEMQLPKVWKLLKGEIQPIPCGTCSWCADNLPLEKVISMDELLLEV